jgi:hypothetical protein
LQPPGVDSLPPGAEFGGVITQPAASYVVRSADDAQFVRAAFYGANPRHDMRL